MYVSIYNWIVYHPMRREYRKGSMVVVQPTQAAT
jgi:hypothetical protein